MKKLIFSLILLLSVGKLFGCGNCFQTERAHPEDGTVTSHPVAHNVCSCPCTAKRWADGTCSVCDHKVVEELHIIRNGGKTHTGKSLKVNNPSTQLAAITKKQNRH
jgi:hypothetical protein